jgi:hypothetical protein
MLNLRRIPKVDVQWLAFLFCIFGNPDIKISGRRRDILIGFQYTQWIDTSGYTRFACKLTHGTLIVTKSRT